MLNERLRELLQGRNQTEFGESLGIGRGTNSRIFKGKPVNNDLLIRIMLKENASLCWLHGLNSSKFVVYRSADPAETKSIIKAGEKYASDHLFLFTGYNVLSIISAREDRKIMQDGYILNFINCKTCTGPIDQSVLDLFNGQSISEINLAYSQAARLSLGEIGTFELFGNTDRIDKGTGIISKAKEISKSQLIDIINEYSIDRPLIAFDDVIKTVEDELIRQGIELPDHKLKKIIFEAYRACKKDGYEVTEDIAALVRRLIDLTA